VTPSDPLTGLRALQRRLRLQRRSIDAAWATSAWLATAAVTLTMVRITIGLDAHVTASVTGSLAALVVLVVRAHRHHRQPWDLLRVARYADTRSHWREQVTTAIEYAHDERPVVKALWVEVRDTLRSVDPVALSPWRWPRAASLSAAVSAAAFVLALSSPPPPEATVAGTTTRAADSFSPTADAVRTVAEQIGGDARRGRDAYLEALADALHDLAATAGIDEVDNDALEQLLEQIAAAYGDDVSADDLRSALGAADTALDAARRSQDGEALAGGEQPPPPARMQVGGSERMDFGAIFTERVEQDPARAGAGGGDAAPGHDTRFGIADPASIDDPDAVTMVDLDGLPGGAGESIGAADTSGAGASQIAGRGAQELEGDAAAADLSASDTEAIAVSGVERDDGRRIEIELPPATEWEGYDPSAFAVGAWRAAPEAPQPERASPLVYRQAAARYFLPSQATATTP